MKATQDCLPVQGRGHNLVICPWGRVAIVVEKVGVVVEIVEVVATVVIGHLSKPECYAVILCFVLVYNDQ